MKIFTVCHPEVKIQEVLEFIHLHLTVDHPDYNSRIQKFSLTKEFSHLDYCRTFKSQLDLELKEFEIDQELVSRLMNETYLVSEATGGKLKVVGDLLLNHSMLDRFILSR